MCPFCEENGQGCRASEHGIVSPDFGFVRCVAFGKRVARSALVDGWVGGDAAPFDVAPSPVVACALR